MTQEREARVQEGRGRVAALTGVTGFIGGHLAPALAARGWRLRALVRRMPRPVATALPDMEVVAGDLGEEAALARLVEGADAVIHLAGAIRGRRRDDFMRANAEGTAALARAWQDRAPRARFVKVSSLAAREPALSPYAASKRAAEEALAETAPGGDWLVLRPAAVYGPGDRETLRILRAAAGPVQPLLNHRSARVSVVHVEDVVGAVLAALEAPLAGRVFEVTDPRPEGYGWEEIVAAVARVTGRALRPLRLPRPLLLLGGLLGEAAALAGAAPMLTRHKLRELLHPDWSSEPARQLPPELWRPRIGLEEGLAETVAWYRRAGWLR